MTDLPGFPIEPIQPPPGSYDGMARRARSRRTRSALLGGGLALAVGAAGLGTAVLVGGPTTKADDRLALTATPSPSSSAEPTASARPDATPTPQPTGTPTVTPRPGASGTSGGPTPSPSEVTTATPTSLRIYRGTVVDTAGQPLAGIRVYEVTGEYDPFDRLAITGPDGTFEVPCDGARVLLVAWDLAQPQPPGTRNLAPVFVDGKGSISSSQPPDCGTGTTTLRPGGILEGAFRVVDDETGEERPPADGAVPGFGNQCSTLGLRVTCAKWAITDGRYRFVGVPGGRDNLQTDVQFDADIRVGAGQTVQRDWYDCRDCKDGQRPKRPTASPTTTPSPTAT